MLLNLKQLGNNVLLTEHQTILEMKHQYTFSSSSLFLVLFAFLPAIFVSSFAGVFFAALAADSSCGSSSILSSF